LNYINLHAHSQYSDGRHTLEENVFAQKKLGMTACVLTDHVYPEGYDFSLNTTRFLLQCDEADKLMDSLGVPIILGIECSVMRMEEINIFGREAIREILRIKSKSQITYDDLVRIKKNFNCIMNYNHPMNPPKFVQAGCMDFLDGYEHIHSCSYTFDEDSPNDKMFTCPPEFKSLVKLCNSDAHHNDMLEWCFNETETPIYTEEELITYVKERQPFKHIIYGKTTRYSEGGIILV
jgi:hypothetical protein